MSRAIALRYEEAGAQGAPAVLFGGSLGTSCAMWDGQVAAFSPKFRTIAFDHRGHGGSPSPDGPYTIDELGHDTLALLDRLKLAKVSYVGVSLGGMVGQWLAAYHPERVERLVLIATSSYLADDPTPWLERAVTVRDAGTTEVVADAVLARWFTPDWSVAHRQVIAGLREMLCATPAGGYAACCEALSRLDLREALARIVAPTLVISGAQDTALPPPHQQAIAAAISGARLETVEDAAHIPSIQHPATVNRLIADHLGVEL